MSPTTLPLPLTPGDRIAIASPASIINPDYVEGAIATLRSWGYDPYVTPHALGRHGSYSGTPQERLEDLSAALLDESTRAILCSRGGYGTVHLLDGLSRLPLIDDPKWVIGFSDISALHALMYTRGIASIHSSMAKQLTLGPAGDACLALQSILRGDKAERKWAFNGMGTNREGSATGPLVGGNIAVLAQLIGTPFDTLTAIGDSRPILFIEDIAEPIYKIERILYQLRLSGAMDRLGGLVVGRFTEYKPDRDHQSMESMIAEAVSPYRFPVAMNAPIGHIEGDNMPIIHGITATLSVTPEQATLTF